MDPALASLLPLAEPPPSLIAAADPSRVAAALSAEVPELRSGSLQVVGCRIEDLRLKGRQWDGRYELTLDGASGRRLMPLSGVLSADGPAGISTHTSVPFGDPGWTMTLTDPPLTLSAPAADRKLPALGVLIDPDAARAWLERQLGDTCPGIRIAACAPAIARYRPGQRCIVVCHLDYAAGSDPTWPATVVAKVYRRGRGAHEYGALQAVAATGPAGLGALRFARPLAYVPDDDVAVQSHLPQDRSLVELVKDAGSRGASSRDATAALASVADALVSLHRSPLRYGGVTGIDDEVASVRDAARKLQSLSALLPPAVQPLLTLVEQRARDAAPDAVAPSHGAFRPAQVRLDGDRVGLLDLDGFGQSEPAQDVGRFLAKLRLVFLVAADDHPTATRVAAADLLAAAFLDRYTAESPVSASRVVLWETLDLLKALLQSWSRARPSQIAPVLALLTDRVAALR